MRAAMKILVALSLSLASYAQTESVTVVQTKEVSETAPAPDCTGLIGFQAGFCAAQRQAAQTPTPHTYYTVQGDRNAYLLTCHSGGGLLTGLRACPVVTPGQQFALSVEGSQVLLRSPGSKDLKLGLVEARAIKPEDGTASASQKPAEMSPVHPAGHDGRSLLRACQVSLRIEDRDLTGLDPLDASMDDGYCVGLVNGILDTHTILGQLEEPLGGRFKPYFCTPDGGLAPAQAIRIVVKYLNENPAELHQPETMLAMMALSDSFPCK